MFEARKNGFMALASLFALAAACALWAWAEQEEQNLADLGSEF